MTKNVKPKVLVLRTAGTNCDGETVYAFEKAGAAAEAVHVNRIVEKPELLDQYKVITIPGGFSYGDDAGAGTVFANELIKRLGESLYRFIEQGKLVLGICNGFQVLAKTGILPGLTRGERTVSLDDNDSGKFEDRWTYLNVNGDRCVFTQGAGKTIYLPVAHREGKVVSLSGISDELERHGNVVFRYAYEDGSPANGKYPENPNGSEGDIAGMCDLTGRALGLMPHPERFVRPEHHPQYTRMDLPTRKNLPKNGDGMIIFKNAVKYARQL